MTIARTLQAAFLALFIAGPVSPVGPALQAQNQGTYLFFEFSGTGPDPALEAFGLIEAESPAPPEQAPQTTTHAPAPPRFTGDGMESLRGSSSAGSSGLNDSLGDSAPSNFSAPTSSFSDPVFGEPADTGSGSGSSFFNEEAFTNPTFGN